jgi:hypothetical protein
MGAPKNLFQFRVLTLKKGIEYRVLDSDIRAQLDELRLDANGLAAYFIQRPDAVVMPMSKIVVSRVQPTRIIRENELLIAAFTKEGEKREPVIVVKQKTDFLILDGNSTYLNGVAARWRNILCIIDR